MKKNAKLRAVDIVKSFKQGEETIQVLNKISAIFEQPQTYSIQGISGEGKSTFIHILSGLDIPTSGKALFNDIDILALRGPARQEFFNKSIGMMFQWPYLIKEMTVEENVMLPGLIAGKKKEECQDRAHMLLKQVGIGHKAGSKPSTLSGGQQQRVVLVRALFNEPAFLIADEPTGSLDMHTGSALVDLLLECNDRWGMGIIVSTHDSYVATRMGIQFELKEGKLIERI